MVQTVTTAAIANEPSPPGDVSSAFDIEVFYDGGCPLCSREIAMLRRKDKRQRIVFTDIADDAFEANGIGRTQDELMAEIHGRLPNGDLIIGVEVFRRLYTAIGFGWIVAVTRWPGISWCLDRGYSVFAKWRLKNRANCKDGVCEVKAG